MKAVVAAFNQEKALVGAFSVITNLRMELFEALNNRQVVLDKWPSSRKRRWREGRERRTRNGGTVSFLTANLTDDGPQ